MSDESMIPVVNGNPVIHEVINDNRVKWFSRPNTLEKIPDSTLVVDLSAKVVSEFSQRLNLPKPCLVVAKFPYI
jgi:hypothetical protein